MAKKGATFPAGAGARGSATRAPRDDRTDLGATLRDDRTDLGATLRDGRTTTWARRP